MPERAPAFIDLFSGHAGEYAQARPSYPAELFAFVADHAPGRGNAWDCATGNGQAALGLAQHFDAVLATDASAEQIAHALPHPRVRYTVQPAEHTQFAAHTFDAVCVAQALHWFDLNRFYAEVDRVLKPEGLIVVLAYDWLIVSPEFDAAFERTLGAALAPYWAPQNALIWNGYRDLAFPYARVTTPDFRMRMRWTLPQLLAYVRTWSAAQKCLAAGGHDQLDAGVRELVPLWGEPEQTRDVAMRLHVLVGRKN